MNSNRNGMLVSSSEAERFTLHQTLRGLMPEAVADTLMSHLPPAGWSDVARTSDIEELRVATKHDIQELRVATKHDIDALRDATKHDIDLLAVRLDNVETRLESIEGKLGDLASMKRYVVTTGIALATLISGFGVPLLLAVT
ncbi:MAG: hypothetical protein ACKO48_04900 [Actinomycetota bacterium]